MRVLRWAQRRAAAGLPVRGGSPAHPGGGKRGVASFGRVARLQSHIGRCLPREYRDAESAGRTTPVMVHEALRPIPPIL